MEENSLCMDSYSVPYNCNWCVACSILQTTPDSGGSNALLGLVASVAILGVLITIISSKIIRGGEYWQKNWEYHVSLLEPLFSGRIYSTLVNKN